MVEQTTNPVPSSGYEDEIWLRSRASYVRALSSGDIRDEKGAVWRAPLYDYDKGFKVTQNTPARSRVEATRQQIDNQLKLLREKLLDAKTTEKDRARYMAEMLNRSRSAAMIDLVKPWLQKQPHGQTEFQPRRFRKTWYHAQYVWRNNKKAEWTHPTWNDIEIANMVADTAEVL